VGQEICVMLDVVFSGDQERAFQIRIDSNSRLISNVFYDKVPETSLLFSLFCTVFAIWKHLEAFGY